MTNNYSTIKLRPSSKKIILARINVRRGIEYSMSLVSGTLYQMTFPFDSLNRIEVDGIAYTKVSGTPASNQYSFDTSTRLLQIELSANIVFFQDVGAIMAFYYIYYTNEIGRYHYSDPEDSSTSIVYYNPRIIGNISFDITQENIIDGIFSIGSLSLNIKNEDNNFNQYLSDYDTFSNAEFKSWHCLDSLDNIKKLYFGSIIDISLSSTNVAITIDDLFGKLNETFVSNGTLESSTYSNSNFTVSDENQGKFILKLYGKSSKCNETTQLSRFQGEYCPLGSNAEHYRFNEIHQAVNVSYTSTISTTTNRTWACCIDSTTSSDLTETVVGKTSVLLPTGLSTWRLTVLDATRYLPGDNVILNQSGTPRYSTVVKVDLTNNYIYIYQTGSFSDGQTLFRPSISYVQWKVTGADDANTGRFALYYSLDYTITTIDNVRCIVLNNNFESNYSFWTFDQNSGILPDAILEFRAWNHDDLNHSVVLQEILESTGLTINQDSFDDAAAFKFNLSGPEIKTNFTLPYWRSESMPTVTEIVQNLLTSTFGYITINNDFEIEYKMFDVPFTPTDSITENDFLMGSLNQKIDYKDIYSHFIFTNDHAVRTYNSPDFSLINTVSNQIEYFYEKATFYHGIKRTKEIKYYIEDIYQTSVGEYISKILSNRRLTISLETKGINFESIIGDEYTIESNKIVGSDEEKNIKILSITKSLEKTTISGIDFLGPT